MTEAEAQALFQELKTFLEENDVSRTASKPLKNGVEIGLTLFGHDAQYYVVKETGRMVVKEGEARRPDWSAVISPAAVHHLKALDNPDIGDLGVEVLKLMAHGVHEARAGEAFVRVHLTAGFFTIMRHGYLGILPLGGPKVARFLAQHNLMSVAGIKRVFKKLRGSEE